MVRICCLPFAPGLTSAEQNCREEIFLSGKHPALLKSKQLLLLTSEEPDSPSVSSQAVSHQAGFFRHFEGVRLPLAQIISQWELLALAHSSACAGFQGRRKEGASLRGGWHREGSEGRNSSARRGAQSTAGWGGWEVQ